jgi:hypothetical protein
MRTPPSSDWVALGEDIENAPLLFHPAPKESFADFLTSAHYP